MGEIVVVGSLNWDVRLTVDALPRSGETILASDVLRTPGGKGANQAVAAARLGRRVAMVGAVGDDDFGRAMSRQLVAEGVDVDGVSVVSHLSTGTATILWEQPESTIVIESGANATVTADVVRSRADLVRQASLVMCQCETPVSALEAVADVATGVTVLNPAPAIDVPSAIRDRFDILVPNRFELAVLAGADQAPTSLDEVEAMVDSLGHPGHVVVTLGAQGCLVLARGMSAVHVPAQSVDAVDTTAAGDSFCAALADGLLAGESLTGAAAWAVRVAARTTLRHGAIASLPLRREVVAGF